jgi:hypothetical protein
LSGSTAVDAPPPRLSLWSKARLGGEIIGVYSGVRRAMRKEDLNSLVRALRKSCRDAEPVPPMARFRLAGAVQRVLSVLPTDSRCLIRSLVLLALLERRGVASTLVIGVRAEPDFAAHAWVESDGRELLPSGGGEYRRLTEI